MEKEFFARVSDYVKRSFLEKGTFGSACFMMLEDEKAEVPPFMTQEGNLVFMPIPLGYATDKNMVACAVRLAAVTLNATALSFVSEAWMVSADTSDMAKAIKITPSQHPERKECLIITNETKTTISSTMIDISRNEDGTPSLGEEKVTDELSGRFANFLYGR